MIHSPAIDSLLWDADSKQIDTSTPRRYLAKSAKSSTPSGFKTITNLTFEPKVNNLFDEEARQRESHDSDTRLARPSVLTSEVSATNTIDSRASVSERTQSKALPASADKLIRCKILRQKARLGTTTAKLFFDNGSENHCILYATRHLPSSSWVISSNEECVGKVKCQGNDHLFRKPDGFTPLRWSIDVPSKGPKKIKADLQRTVLVNKALEKVNGLFLLEFEDSRVKVASIKNMALVVQQSDQDEGSGGQIALQFGRAVAEDEFILDFRSPFTLETAFAIGLGQL